MELRTKFINLLVMLSLLATVGCSHVNRDFKTSIQDQTKKEQTICLRRNENKNETKQPLEMGISQSDMSISIKSNKKLKTTTSVQRIVKKTGLFVDITNYLYYTYRESQDSYKIMSSLLDSIQSSGFVTGIRWNLIKYDRWLDDACWLVNESYERNLAVIFEINEQASNYDTKAYNEPFNGPDYSNDAIRAFNDSIREIANMFNGIACPIVPIWIVGNEPNVKNLNPEVPIKLLANTYLILNELKLPVKLVGPGVFISKPDDIHYINEMNNSSTMDWMVEHGFGKNFFTLSVNFYPHYSRTVDGLYEWNDVMVPMKFTINGDGTCTCKHTTGRMLTKTCSGNPNGNFVYPDGKYVPNSFQEYVEYLLMMLSEYQDFVISEFGFKGSDQAELILETVKIFNENGIEYFVLYKWDRNKGNSDGDFGIANPNYGLTQQGLIIQKKLGHR